MAFLLLERRLPNGEEASAFRAELRTRAGVDPGELTFLKSLPKEGHPMSWLITGLNYMRMVARDYAEDARNVIARAPEPSQRSFESRGWGEPIAPRPDWA